MQVKALADKTDTLSSGTGTHMMKERSDDSYWLLFDSTYIAKFMDLEDSG